MKACGTLLQFFGVTVLVLGVIAGIAQMLSPINTYYSYASNSAFIIIVSSVLSGLFLYGVGGAFITLADMAVDARRTADALDILVQHQTGVGTLPPTLPPAPPRSSVIRPLGKSSNSARLLRSIRRGAQPPTE